MTAPNLGRGDLEGIAAVLRGEERAPALRQLWANVLLEETPRERQARELDDLEVIAANDLDAALKVGWDRYRAWVDQMEKLMTRKLGEIVRNAVPAATAVCLHASDQGGDGWAAGGTVRTAEGEVDAAHALYDDDDLSSLLMDLGLFLPNSEHGTRQGVFWLELDPKEPDA